ncbi:NADPH:quinone reductase-like Zn-dependent oxidoreductase [Kutzneria kofuensis]|uniref:NADPH:quinone reductase-like Zn-dependent oxidoreductase n=1 Tax=Kutzneria kofuensis TaxID=103725 RepID=A0A7W9KBS1_9PSEU|nr:NAD(P)-dependent alcohol dehydrogenase [Kutzneria kofuensis]MBB5889540.1 NADPH:quinone reductase-like Zn-dependent oxidoreductase [Kutzneria kofuensis]
MRAASVDPSIWHLTTGEPYLIRLMGFGLRRPKRPVPGLDLGGIVEAIGPGVTNFRPGDEVFGTADGSFAEYVSVKATRVVRKPDNVTFDQAAAVPASACTRAHVVGVCSTAKIELVHVLGADDVIDYKREAITGRYDVIIDTAGDRPLSQLRHHLTPRGTLIIVGGEGGG